MGEKVSFERFVGHINPMTTVEVVDRPGAPNADPERAPGKSEADHDRLFHLPYAPVRHLLGAAAVNASYLVAGHARSVRAQARVTFLQLDDGSGPDRLQLVLAAGPLRDKVAAQLHVAATITARGRLVVSQGKGQARELLVEELAVVGPIAEPASFLPSLPHVSADTWRQHVALRPHWRVAQATFRIRSLLMKTVHDFFHTSGFHHLDPNTITRADCEGAGEMFAVTTLLDAPDRLRVSRPVQTDLDQARLTSSKQLLDILQTANGQDGKEVYGREATALRSALQADIERLEDAAAPRIEWGRDFFGLDVAARLTVSSQLQLEALCHAMGPVYTTNPSYRAEPSKTTRHVASFTHVEWELPFIEMTDLMDLSDDLVRHCFRTVARHAATDLALLEAHSPSSTSGLRAKLEAFAAKPFLRVSYDDALDRLHADRHTVLKLGAGILDKLPEWGDDLGGVCERYLAEVVYKHPVFVHSYPRKLKAFYAAAGAPSKRGETVQAVDLLVPGLGELIGSSIREHRHEALCDELERRAMDSKPLQWYIDLRKNGSVPTGGAGMGFDRLVTICTANEGNIRDAIPFPVAFRECPL